MCFTVFKAEQSYSVLWTRELKIELRLRVESDGDVIDTDDIIDSD